MNNTKESIHKYAKEVCMEPYYLGCSCSECNLKFEKALNKIPRDNVYAREVWNAAIEAAARCVHLSLDAEQIRKLKKMSVEEELNFDNGWVIVRFIEDGPLIIKLDVPCAVASLDLSQAHLLMLYLQKHLNNPQINKPLDDAITNELKHSAAQHKII